MGTVYPQARVAKDAFAFSIAGVTVMAGSLKAQERWIKTCRNSSCKGGDGKE